MLDAVQEWHHEDAIFEAFWRILQTFWPPKLAKGCWGDTPQQRGYTLSVPMGPIDGHMGVQLERLSVCTGEAVGSCARPKDAYFRTAEPGFLSGVRLTLILFIYQGGSPLKVRTPLADKGPHGWHTGVRTKMGLTSLCLPFPRSGRSPPHIPPRSWFPPAASTVVPPGGCNFFLKFGWSPARDPGIPENLDQGGGGPPPPPHISGMSGMNTENRRPGQN
eukprot:gene14732-biopygen9660